MNFDPDSQIRLECNNWYEIDNDLIKICMRNGYTILLNPNYKEVWLGIGYGITLSDLKINLKDKITDEEFYRILEELNEIELINIIQPKDEFDVIFN